MKLFVHEGKSYLPHLISIAAIVLFVSAVDNSTGQPATLAPVAEKHAAYMERQYWLRDAGREREEMRQLAIDVQFAELSEQAKRIRK